MNIKEKAKQFAIMAHCGQVRKNEPEKPMIIHPLAVGQLLESFGCDDHVVAAGYLHDVVEDTKYTLEDIKENFGEDIANLVMTVSEPDKTLSWEERKKHTIEVTKNLPYRNKLVVCADKINNLEDLGIKFTKTGERDFSAFKRGEEASRWYYTEVYKSLINGGYAALPPFVRLKEALDQVFYQKEDNYLKDTIFVNDGPYYEKLTKLHAQKVELQRLKALLTLKEPFIIEFMGTPRSGKTTAINNLYDFFKKGGFNVKIIEEFTTSKYYKDNLKKQLANLSDVERYLAIADIIDKQLGEASNTNEDIILIDRSINDRQIWNYRLFSNGSMPQEQYQSVRNKYIQKSRQLINFLVITYTDALTALKRDYTSSLALEDRSFLNEHNLQEYNNNLRALQDLFWQVAQDVLYLDTTQRSLRDTSLEMAKYVLPAIRTKYIKELNIQYNAKKTLN